MLNRITRWLADRKERATPGVLNSQSMSEHRKRMDRIYALLMKSRTRDELAELIELDKGEEKYYVARFQCLRDAVGGNYEHASKKDMRCLDILDTLICATRRCIILNEDDLHELKV